MMHAASFRKSSSSISNMRSTTAACRTCCAWWPTCWMRTSGTCAPSDSGAASSARHRRSTSAPTRLFVGYALWAEMTCFMHLGWRFPVHVFDLHTAYLATSNILLPYDPDEVAQEAAQALVRRLPRLRHRGLGEHRQGGAWPRRSARAAGANTAAKAVFEYCEEDVRNRANCCARSSPRLSAGFPPIDADRASCTGRTTAPRPSPGSRPAACRSTYLLWNLVQENKPAVIGALMRRFDPSHGSDDPIYTPEGEWSYARFEHWLVAPASPPGRGWIAAL